LDLVLVLVPNLDRDPDRDLDPDRDPDQVEVQV
jgi:hypothetical protein